MQGRIIKIISDFFYAASSFGIVEAKLRSVVKKRGEEVFIGDIAELEQFNEKSMQAFISEIMPRKSLLQRPKAANIDKIIIVSALKEPDLDFEQLDRFIAQAEYHKIEPVLCFNKTDIKDSESLKKQAESIYKPLGYKIFFVSAVEGSGAAALKSALKGSVCVLCGESGAGKSSLINAFLNSSRMKTAPVSMKTQRGSHTTRYSELVQIDENTFAADTPGFSLLKFDFLPPSAIQKLFAEFKDEKSACRYKNCLHTGGAGCAYQHITESMPPSRYESYKKFVKEALEYQQKISQMSIKNEGASKYNRNKITAKISEKKRASARKTAKQKMHKEEMNYE